MSAPPPLGAANMTYHPTPEQLDQSFTNCVREQAVDGPLFLFTAADTARAFSPYRSRTWVYRRLAAAADGTNPLPGITISRKSGTGIYGLLFPTGVIGDALRNSAAGITADLGDFTQYVNANPKG